MPVKDPEDVFLLLLSEARQGAESSTKLFAELAEFAQDREIKELLSARVFTATEIIKKLDECFKLLGAHPICLNTRIQEMFATDLRRELSDMQFPQARRLYVLAKAMELLHLRMGDYEALIEAADLTGHCAVGTLLESCLAEKAAFINRTRRLIRKRVAQRLLAAA